MMKLSGVDVLFEGSNDDIVLYCQRNVNTFFLMKIGFLFLAWQGHQPQASPSARDPQPQIQFTSHKHFPIRNTSASGDVTLFSFQRTIKFTKFLVLFGGESGTNSIAKGQPSNNCRKQGNSIRGIGP